MIEWLNDERPKFKTAESVYIIEFYHGKDIRVTPCVISSALCHLVCGDKICFSGDYLISGWLYNKKTKSLGSEVNEAFVFKSKELADQMAVFKEVYVSAGDWLFATGLEDEKHPNYWFNINESELPSGHTGVSEIREMFLDIKNDMGAIEFDRLNLEKSIKWLVDLNPSLKEKWTKKDSSMGKILNQLNIVL